MKKIFRKIIMVLVATTIVIGGGQADELRGTDLQGKAWSMAKERGVEVDLHTSVQWYEDAIIQAFLTASGLKEQNSKLNAAYQLVLASYEAVPSSGVVIISPAKLLEGCIKGITAVTEYSDEIVSWKCAMFVVRAVQRHNRQVESFLSLNPTAVSIDDADTTVCWDGGTDFYNSFFGRDEQQFFLDAFATEKEWALWDVNGGCVTLSINEVRARCETALSDADTARKVNADPTICQKYVEHLVNAHNARIEYNKSVQGIK